MSVVACAEISTPRLLQQTHQILPTTTPTKCARQLGRTSLAIGRVDAVFVECADGDCVDAVRVPVKITIVPHPTPVPAGKDKKRPQPPSTIVH